MALNFPNPFAGQTTTQPQQPVLPRVPYKQNPAITMAGIGLMSGRNLNEGFSNLAQTMPAGLAAKSGMQQFMVVQQERERQRAEQEARKAQMNEALKNWPSLSPEQKALFRDQPDLFAQYAVSTMKPKELPNSVQEYQYGQQDPAYTDWRKDLSAAGAPKTVGTPPPGWRIVYDGAGNPASMEEIPGGPAEAARRADEKRAEVEMESTLSKSDTMLDATRNIKKVVKNSPTPAVGTNSRPFAWHSDTPAGQVRSYVKGLQSGVALQTMMKLKEASSTGATGFGALSERELDVLISSIGALDPDNTSETVFLDTIERIEKGWLKVLRDVQSTVPPERLAEMGFDMDALISGASGGGTPSQEDPLGIR